MDDLVCCPYCNTVAVELDEYDPDHDWAVGHCKNCGEPVEYDYDPAGVTGFKDGRPVYT